ncbi:MAG: hypothetical protein IJL37_01870 [Bacteroidaceae bacterium]|nr:hypothetical protein [Bacteroidaceae bacterium]
MKTNFYFLASLTLGLLATSCQNGLEEVLEQKAVQDELATTRVEIETPIDEEIIEEYALGPAISGPTIITGTSQVSYTVNPPFGSVNTIWSHNTAIFNEHGNSDTALTVSLKNANTTADVTIFATFYDSNNNVISQSRFDTGINGPHYNHCSIRVIRSSDGAEIYPNHTAYMEPNTYYYAYFYTSTGGSMDLDWSFYDDGMEILNSYAHTLYFKTGSDNYDCFLHVDGRMYGSSITKALLGVVLY